MATRCLSALLLWSFLSLPALAAEPLSDAPVVWWEDDRNDIEEPAERDPNLLRDQIHSTMVRPVQRNASPSSLSRRVGSWFGGDHWRPAANVNALDEVPNSTWFTNRIGFFPMGADEIARGPGAGNGPDRSGPWTIFSAKTEGVTPGFNIRDAKGDAYLIKFDPQGYPGSPRDRGPSRAGSSGPRATTFPRTRSSRSGARISCSARESRSRRAASSARRPSRTSRSCWPGWTRSRPGSTRRSPVGSCPAPRSVPSTTAVAARTIRTTRCEHDYRRELRGLRVFAGWLNHFDTKQHNSLDMFVEEDGRGFVKHYLIDFASTIGTGARGPTPLYGWEYGFDFPQTMARLFTVGLKEDDWRRLERPERSRRGGVLGHRALGPAGVQAAHAEQRVRAPDRPRRLLGGEDHLGVHRRAAPGRDRDREVSEPGGHGARRAGPGRASRSDRPRVVRAGDADRLLPGGGRQADGRRISGSSGGCGRRARDTGCGTPRSRLIGTGSATEASGGS